METEELINVVTCSVWIPRGAAKEDPKKVELSKEELARIIKETSDNLDDLKVTDDDTYNELEVDSIAADLNIDLKSSKAKCDTDIEMKDEGTADESSKDQTDIDDINDIIEKYGLEDYDDEDNEGGVGWKKKMADVGHFAVHASNEDDPNLTNVDDEDTDSEKQNVKILPSDNLIAVGHVEGDAAILEVYVYNSKEGSLYVHHDILLPAVPLCMEWLNFDPTDKQLAPGNLVAVGSMSPIVEVWDLNVMDCLEPSFKLGRRPNKKKKMSRRGHSDAILSLAWNRDLEHVLASGSADRSVILWDIQKCEESQKIASFKHRVQDIQWNPEFNHHLLTASSDKFVRLIDCLDDEMNKCWKLDGEVECLAWDVAANNPYKFYAATDCGTVYSMDTRQEKKFLQTFQAHPKTCTGISVVPECPGCLVTASEDETIKIWDTNSQSPKLVESQDMGLGVIHSISSSADAPFVFSIAGSNKMNNFKVWDIRTSKEVRSGFYDRLGLSVDDDDDAEETQNEAGMGDVDHQSSSEAAKASSANNKWKPSKKSKKKKSGRVEKKNR